MQCWTLTGPTQFARFLRANDRPGDGEGGEGGGVQSGGGGGREGKNPRLTSESTVKSIME